MILVINKSIINSWRLVILVYKLEIVDLDFSDNKLKNTILTLLPTGVTD